MITVIWKELREHLRWVPLGTLPVTIVVVYQWRFRGVIFDEYGTLAFTVALIGCIFASGLGLAQFWPDERPAARALLLHRGIPHDAVFLAKLLAAVGIYSAALLSPLLCLAVWIAWAGQNQAAAYPSAVFPSLLVAAAAFSGWSASILGVRRESRWLGSRLFRSSPRSH